MFRAARHQSVKIDQPDLLHIICLCFEGLEPHHRLWPFAGQSLRARFRQLCQAFAIQASPGGGRPYLELSSLRAGGATWFMLATEDVEMLRRHGRWLSPRIMEIYVQEVLLFNFYHCSRPGPSIASTSPCKASTRSSLTRPSTIAYGSRPSIGTFFSPLARVRERTNGWFDGVLAITV